MKGVRITLQNTQQIQLLPGEDIVARANRWGMDACLQNPPHHLLHVFRHVVCGAKVQQPERELLSMVHEVARVGIRLHDAKSAQRERYISWLCQDQAYLAAEHQMNTRNNTIESVGAYMKISHTQSRTSMRPRKLHRGAGTVSCTRLVKHGTGMCSNGLNVGYTVACGRIGVAYTARQLSHALSASCCKLTKTILL